MKAKSFSLFIVLVIAVLSSSASGAAGPVAGNNSLTPSGALAVNPSALVSYPAFAILTQGEVIYLIRSDDLTLDRWSVAERKYLFPPFSLAEAPDFMAYSEETNRIFLSYPNRSMTQIKLDETPLREAPFINTPQPLTGMLVTGSFIFTSDSTRHYTYSLQGILISQVDRPAPGGYHTWSPADRRLYYFIDSMYPNDFQWETIGIDGVISPTVSPLYHLDEATTPPLRITPDGSMLYFGSGVAVDAADFVVLERSTEFKDTIWHGDDRLWVRWDQPVRNTVLAKRNGEYSTVRLKGYPFQLFEISEGILVLSKDDTGTLIFSILDWDLNLLFETPYYPTYVPLVDKDYCRNVYDDFGHPATGWIVDEDEDVRTEYLNGEYRVLTKNDAYYYMYMAPGCQRQYYQVEVDARWEGAPGHSYGIVYDINEDWSQYYIFIVNSEYQVYGLYEYQEEYGYLYEYSLHYSSAILPGANTNHMKVTRRYDNLLLEINGTIVLEKNDPDNNAPSGVGLVVMPYDDYPVADARFDNFLERFLNKSEIYPGGVSEPILDQGCSSTSSTTPARYIKMGRQSILLP